MTILELLQSELENEAVTTRKMLALVPNEKFSWKPHEKSMTMLQLATHVAEIPGWFEMILTTSELDFGAADYQPSPINSTKDLLDFHEKSVTAGKESLSKATEDDLWKSWTMRTGDIVHQTDTKYGMLRTSMSQTTHHRAQLGVYLRLLDVPIPGSYGPSADDPSF